ncbi:MAG: hypothetical protein KIT25_06280 [Enhydrobacter sp.]|nr:MAG: hypothetical protein KIT25_06280 [Enhydrobacter sp.]
MTGVLMLAFGLLFTATLSAVIQRAATRPPPAHPFDVFADSQNRPQPAANSGTEQALDCRPDAPSFRLGSPFRQRSLRDPEPMIVPGPPTIDPAPSRRSL